MNDTNKHKTRDILKKHGFMFKKKWGQNFITDANLLRKIVLQADINPGDSVVEIGPGAGTLTRALAETGAKVLAVEIDNSLLPILKETLKDQNVTIINKDILKLDLDKTTTEYGISWPYKVVANLPYYITTPVILSLLEKGYHLDLMVFMVQWEVAERLTALPGTKEYGAVTLAVQYYSEPSLCFKVSRQLFMPVPEVDSAVIALRKRESPPVEVEDVELMFKIIKAGFGQRRKTLSNALQNVNPSLTKEQVFEILAETKTDPQRRGETLSLQEYAQITNSWTRYLDIKNNIL